MARKEKLGEAWAAARVVVGPPGDHDFGAVAEGALGQAGALEVVEPDRAGHGALAVAQLEVGLDLAAADPGHLADEADPRAAAKLLLQLAGVAADRERARKLGFYRLRRYPARFHRRAQVLSSSIAGPSSAPAAVRE